jgi:hypothetical protein
VGIGGTVVGVVNFGANAVLVSQPPIIPNPLRDQAKAELSETLETVKAVGEAALSGAKMVLEDPEAAGTKIVDAGKRAGAFVADKAEALANGDTRVIADVTGGLVEIAADIVVGSKGANLGARAAKEGVEAVGDAVRREVAEEVLENVAESSATTAARTQAAVRSRAAATTVDEGRAAARAATPEAGVSGRASAGSTGSSGGALQTFFPPNQGFLGDSSRVFLRPGERIDRFGGSDFSRFFSPAGTPKGARALPPGTSDQPLRTFEVLKPFEVEAGTVAPAFGELGLGTQFRTPVTLKFLLKREIIEEITP